MVTIIRGYICLYNYCSQLPNIISNSGQLWITMIAYHRFSLDQQATHWWYHRAIIGGIATALEVVMTSAICLYSGWSCSAVKTGAKPSCWFYLPEYTWNLWSNILAETHEFLQANLKQIQRANHEYKQFTGHCCVSAILCKTRGSK